MDATPEGRASRRKRKAQPTPTEYAAPQQPEFWDPTTGRWLKHAPIQGVGGAAGAAGGDGRRAHRINPAAAAGAQPVGMAGPGGSGVGANGGVNPYGMYGGYGAGYGGGYSPAVPPMETAVPEPAPQKPRPSVGRRIWRAIKGLILAIILIFVLGGVAGAVDFSRNVTRTDALTEHMVGKTSGTNWLLVGSDSRATISAEKQKELGTGGNLGSQRTDTIMLMHIPYFKGQKVLVSIPRDSFVNIPGYGMGKINSAYAFGGAQLLVKTVEQATGVHIDHYMEIGLEGFADLTDAVQGVTICPKHAMSDPLANLDIPAGCQKVNGDTALGYVRSRNSARGDLDRVEHQREFLNAFVHKATKPSTLLNPITFFPLCDAAGKSLTLDKNTRMPSLLRLLLAMSGKHITATLPIGDLTTNSSGAVVLWNEDTDNFWNHIAQGTDIPENLLNQNPLTS